MNLKYNLCLNPSVERAVVKGQSSKRWRGGGGRLGKPVLEWAVPGGCIRPPLPGLEGWSLAVPDSKELTRLARASPSGSPQAKSRFYSPLIFSFIPQSTLYDLYMHSCACLVNLSSPGNNTFHEGRVSSVSVAFTPGLALSKCV